MSFGLRRYVGPIYQQANTVVEQYEVRVLILLDEQNDVLYPGTGTGFGL